MNKEFLLTLLQKVIKVERGGPESRVGKLLAVEDDYIVLLTKEDGVVYYKTEHIKSITEDSKNPLVLEMEVPNNFKFVTGPNFNGILKKLRFAWVKINRGGPESLEGVLDEVQEEDGIVTVILKEEVIRVALFHIRNVSYGLKLKKVKDDNNG